MRMAKEKDADILNSGQCMCNKKTLGIVAVVCSLIILVEAWSAGDLLARTGTVYSTLGKTSNYTDGLAPHSEPGKQIYDVYQPRKDISRESDGCSCINRQTQQLRNLTSGQPLIDAECPAARNASFFQPGQNTHLTALASFPASGNTWTRHLIEYISGILTGSVYGDGSIADAFKGSKARPNHSVLTIKTHRPYGVDKIAYDNVVLLIRPPNEAVASFFNYKKVGHTGNAAPTAFNSTRWTNHVNATIPNWRKLYLSYLNKYKGKLLLLSYRKLKSDFLSELCRLGTFLNITISYETLWCALNNREGKFHRKSNVDYTGVYTNLEMDRINSALHDVKQAIAQRLGDDALDGVF